jgi:bifunctional UDP-N-acetylglucosamine pyrophosphorylase/glucosamine-1-phosphate N-acetyltransferase
MFLDNINIVVLAAGSSTRMNSCFPKVLHKIGNLELVNHILKTVEKIPVKDAILVCDKNLEFTNKSNVEIKKVFQNKKLGTGDAVNSAIEHLKKDVTIILYADTPLVQPQTLNNLLKKIIDEKYDLGLLLFDVKDDNPNYGRVFVDNDKVKQIIEFNDLEKHNINKNTFGNSGVIIIKNKLLLRYLPLIRNENSKKEFYLTDVINFAIKDKKNITYIITDENEAIGINNRTDLSRAELYFNERKRKFFLENGVTLLDPSTTYFSYDTEIDNDVIIHQNVIFGEGVKIQSGAEILPFCYIENANIGSGAKIGPFARVRNNTNIKSNVEIGNFVELKNSKIHENVKIKHLSYIGDTEIKENSNIGAGTITCNFDGIKKHKTFIGENCFIGANNTIIAPLKIGNNAKTGAGSTITDDVPENSLAIARCRQENK